MKSLAASVIAAASFCAFATDPIDVQVPGSDQSSEPCTPKQRTDDYHKNHYKEDIEKSQGQDFDIVLFGDSITDFWNSNPNLSLDGNPNNTKTFNMGIGSDRVQNILWRLRDRALEGYTTKYMTLMIGINNGHQKCIDHNDHADRPEDVAESIRLMLKEMAAKQPNAKILLMPILPYSFDSKYFEAAEVTAMSEAVNDYILQFVDNKRVFWVDLRSKYLKRDSMPNKECYREGGRGGYDAVGLCLHPEFSTYSDFWKPALTNAMHKYLSVPAGQAHVADPSLGYAKAAPNADGAGSATITVFGINLGTDANANAVTSYAIDYELDGGAKTRALSNQTGVRKSFVIPNVALGDHTCKVTVTTADNKELVTLLDFTMTEPWYASPLPTDDSAIRTDGTLKYAYTSSSSACTVKGVTFAAAGNNNANISGDISWPYSQTSGASAPSSISGAYHDLLDHCWWANQGDKTVTLKNLTPGNTYLVQIFGYRNYNSDSKAHVWIKESYWDPNFIKVYGDGWSCGGALTGTFTATESTKTFTITSDGNYGINAIQVRDLGESGVPTVVLPSVGSVFATTNGTAATVFLSGIVMGTDDAGTNATSYSVSYSLDNAAAVAALTGQTASTASFAIPNLANGEHTCAVTITTDKGKTSAAKSVTFRIGPPPPEVVNPSIESISVSTNGTTATISLSGVVMGTDSEGVAASSYSVSCSLTNAPAATVLANESGATASFDIADLADGVYSCSVSITTDKGKTSAAKSINFRIGELPPAPVGWTAEPMDAAGAKFSTEGTLVYAYAAQGQTVNTIPFTRALPVDSTHKIAFAPAATGFDGSLMNEGVADSGYGLILGNGWTWTDSSTDTKAITLTLKDLTPGERYLVQILSHTHWSSSMIVSANGCESQHVYGSDEAGGKYGALITGIFTASAATEDVEILFSGSNGDRPVNAIQVRDIGEGGGVIVIAPSIGSASVTTNGTTATVSLSGVVMGTDSQGTNATSYAVSYSLTNAPAVTALSNQTGATASFDIENLADGSYTCEVTITTDKNRTATKLVSFTINTSGQGGGGGEPGPVPVTGWVVATLTDATAIQTSGNSLYAYRGASTSLTLGDVTFEAGADLSSASIVFDPAFSAANVQTASNTGTLRGLGWDFGISPGMADIKLTLSGLVKGCRYLVEILAHSSYGDANITIGDLDPVNIRDGQFATVYGSFTAESSSHDVVFKMGGAGGVRYVNAIQVRELPASEPVDVDAPVIGGTGVDVPFAVSSDKVAITISNAAAGHTYGYKKSTTLAGLATATTVWLASPAQSAGVLTLEIAKDSTEPSCFYQIVVQ
ncbi:MAG: hypothetical protein J5727_03975 [Kiritimatiellae bacterium]|nr:hypothetical protein [Kiritimatiellia bacterium]